MASDVANIKCQDLLYFFFFCVQELGSDSDPGAFCEFCNIHALGAQRSWWMESPSLEVLKTTLGRGLAGLMDGSKQFHDVFPDFHRAGSEEPAVFIRTNCHL